MIPLVAWQPDATWAWLQGSPLLGVLLVPEQRPLIALLGALLAALLAVRADRSAERAARAEGVGQAPVDDRPRDQDADRGEAADSVDAAPRRDATD